MAQTPFLPLCTLYTVKSKTGQDLLYGVLNSESALVVASDLKDVEPGIEKFKVYFLAPNAAYDKQVEALKRKAKDAAAQLAQPAQPQPAAPRTREPGEDNE